MTTEDRVKAAIRTIEDFPKPGIGYKDISTFFLQPALVSSVVIEGAEKLASIEPDAIAGVESRGFILGLPLALALGIPFIMIRKEGKLPAATFNEAYQLEYGSAAIEMHCDALRPGARVIVSDDVLATGGTAMAAVKLIEQAKAHAVGCFFLAELSFLNGRKPLSDKGIEVISAAVY